MARTQHVSVCPVTRSAQGQTHPWNQGVCVCGARLVSLSLVPDAASARGRARERAHALSRKLEQRSEVLHVTGQDQHAH